MVTGSTRGIGRAIALELAAAGANIIVHGRDPAAAREVANAVHENNRHAEELTLDLALPNAPEQLVERAWNLHPLDAWINNAGVDVLTGAAANWSFAEKLDDLWQVDVRAAIAASRAVGARMKDRGQGTIVNVGWDQAELGMAGDSGEMFAAVKAAVTAFTRSLAKSLAPQVRVNCIAPGWIRTAWGEAAPAAWQRRAQAESLLNRWGTPEDVARAVRYLVSPAASFINAQTLNINGGFA